MVVVPVENNNVPVTLLNVPVTWVHVPLTAVHYPMTLDDAPAENDDAPMTGSHSPSTSLQRLRFFIGWHRGRGEEVSGRGHVLPIWAINPGSYGAGDGV